MRYVRRCRYMVGTRLSLRAGTIKLNGSLGAKNLSALGIKPLDGFGLSIWCCAFDSCTLHNHTIYFFYWVNEKLLFFFIILIVREDVIKVLLILCNNGIIVFDQPHVNAAGLFIGNFLLNSLYIRCPCRNLPAGDLNF